MEISYSFLVKAGGVRARNVTSIALLVFVIVKKHSTATSSADIENCA